MKKTIGNSDLSITVKQHGAELSSIKGADGMEYMWQADPAIWGRHAPVLFPIVGKLAEDRYTFEGNTYTLGQHGFVRDMAFQLIDETGCSMSCELVPTPETKKVFPFDFILWVDFQLEKNSIKIQYKVKNNGLDVMPFSIGAHPAFSLAWGKDDKIEDYFLEFEKSETVDTHHLDSNHLLSDEIENVLENETVLPLRSDMYNRDALILMDLVSEKVSLCSHRHKRRVTVEFPGFPYLGIWAKPAAPYVCIEPWYGHVDPARSYGELMNKPGIIKLDPGEIFTCMHRIIIDETD